ncbi:MAG: 4Fe-4S dicluster domain-containing protein [Spirochaetes bacterium]|nr:4Fe-4S dicluster domain-containing protein [Spirochaetota bacterium]
MIENIRQAARVLLESGRAQVVIGYGDGSAGKARAVFIRKAEDAGQLVYNEYCLQNLASYLIKDEVKKLGKIAIVANSAVMRSVIQLTAENYIEKDSVLVIWTSPDAGVRVLANNQELSDYISKIPVEISAKDRELLDKIEKMSREERWKFWTEELSRCIKCYACRAACPLCNCTRCTVDCNQPQWIRVPSHELGNLEWHIMHAMHLAGRCVNCMECFRACPMGIPLHILTLKLAEDIEKTFGVRSGTLENNYVLSTYKTDDKENFIR